MNTINSATIALVEQFEGLELEAYPDPASKNDPKRKGKPWTIGYGHTGGLSVPTVTEGDRITQGQAEQYLVNDLNAAGAIVARHVTVALNDNQFGALTSFVFNLGEPNFVKSSVLAYVNAGNFSAVPGRMALYRMADGKVMDGLVRRRQAEGQLWLTPVDGTPAASPVVRGQVQPDQNNKPSLNVPVLGGLATLGASLSGDVKTIIGNITDTIGVNPSIALLVLGLAFGGYLLWQHMKKDR